MVFVAWGEDDAPQVNWISQVQPCCRQLSLFRNGMFLFEALVWFWQMAECCLCSQSEDKCRRNGPHRVFEHFCCSRGDERVGLSLIAKCTITEGQGDRAAQQLSPSAEVRHSLHPRPCGVPRALYSLMLESR